MNDLEKLFQEWKSALCEEEKFDCTDCFIQDGVVSCDRWDCEEHKILFILKETNREVNSERNLTTFLREGGGADTWNGIARWASILLSEIPSDGADFRKKALSRIAAINVKKTCGEGTANRKEIQRHIQIYGREKKRYFLKRQIEIIKPTLIISCVGNLWYDVLDNLGVKRSNPARTFFSAFGKNLEYDYFRFADGKEIPIFQYRHPNRCNIDKSRKDLRCIQKIYLEEKDKDKTF
ncbi:MAG: hypothetical protein NC548_57625 [Lachnospiraceae bacterium]|nr:hypothetical protein [Lachnospiraceae bacterium]